ncbi:pyridoxal-phosphate dependent enzyme [Streptomyces acidiscabies]|uniref:Pyridoxal-5'-phosphate-dependent protein n=1 Tax=Streptomyces acidiscabies TaxID=42234 RepID=A0A0L0K506_9ACTN|nr:pyridoxal-phosphate dependent enzyme [Streptomyces acidiscabies]KND33192.1 pyridoxal-5'-phosphate-dependent protein [Streptomyces acidiscabies]
MIYGSMHEAIGRTPLVRLRLDAPSGVEVYAKLELANPFAMKDRVARHIILRARSQGVLRPGAPIVESSSGTMALGVALVGRALGHEVHIVTDPRIDAVTRAKLRSLGCELHVVAEMTAQGWQGARLERLDALMRDLPGAFWPQQYSNPDNPGAYRELADELRADLGRIDTLVGAVGSGGSLCGSVRALRRTLPDLWAVGVDCVGSALFDQPDEPRRLQSGLGNSLLPKNLDRRVIDEVHWLNDREAFEAAVALAGEQQIFAGNTSGSVYRVLGDVAARARPGSRVVGIFPDRGDRYADTVHDPDHWAAHRLDELESSLAPEAVDYGTTVRSWSRAVFKGSVDKDRHLLFIESNTTGTGMMALRSSAALDLRPVLLTGDPDRYAGLDGTGCEVLRCDTNDAVALRSAIQERFAREEIAGVTTTSDFYVPAVADVAEWLGLPGNPVRAVTLCRNKALLRAALAEAGVGQPRFAVVTGPDEVADAVAGVGLPCVVKPADDSGSNNVLLCRTVREAAAQAEVILGIHTNMRGMPTARTVLVEEFVDAPEFSVEMFSRDGVAACVGVTAKQVGGAPYFVESRHLFPAGLPARDRAALVDAVTAALTACGVALGPTHTEVRLTADGPVIIEINPRLAGGMIPELIRLATGVDLLEQQLRAAVGQAPVLTPTREGYAGIRFLIPGREGVLARVDGVPAATAVTGVDRVTVTGRAGARVRPARNAYDRLGHVIASAPTPAAVDGALDTAVAAVRLEIEDEPPGGGR